MKSINTHTGFALKLLSASIFLSTATINSANAAGLQLMPGSPNFGTAGAGHAAVGEGAGSAWANPASMTQLEGNHLGFGLIGAQTDIQFDADDPDADSGGNAGGTIFIPSFSYAHSLTDDLKLGLSMVVPFGNAIDYDDDWVGQDAATEVGMNTLQFMPSMAYRLNDQWSFGAGITVNQTTVHQELEQVKVMPGVYADLGLEASGTAYGWTAGTTYEFNSGHRLGLVYRSQVDTDLSGDADLSAEKLGLDETLDADLNWENPASLMLSGYHELDNDWSVMWDLGRTFYSAFETTEIEVPELGDAPLEIHRNWQDADRFAFGAHYNLTPKVILQAGYSYDESSVSDENRTADMPLDDIQRYTAGALYQVTEDVQLAFGLEYAQLGNARIEAESDEVATSGLLDNISLDSPPGDYESSAIATSFSVNYQF